MSMIFNCSACLSKETLEIRFDKRGRPYIKCFGCGLHLFISSEKTFSGILFFGKLLDEFNEIQLNQLREFAKSFMVQCLPQGFEIVKEKERKVVSDVKSE